MIQTVAFGQRRKRVVPSLKRYAEQMKNLDEYIHHILENRRSEDETSLSSFELIENALSHFPNSAKLHCIKGDSIQLGSEKCPFDLSEALACYEKAIVIDKECAEAYESIGYYYDVINEDLEKSEAAFRKSIDIEEREDSYVGLARVLAQRGIEQKIIIEMLNSTPFRKRKKIQEIKSEIEKGRWD